MTVLRIITGRMKSLRLPQLLPVTIYVDRPNSLPSNLAMRSRNLFKTRTFKVASTMPSALEPADNTPVTYASMAKSKRGVKRQEQQPLYTDGSPSSTPASHGRNTNNTSSSQPSQQTPQHQRRGGGRGRGGHAAYYQRPSSQRQQRQHSRKGHTEEEEDVYVLTLLTDPAHERAMSALRRRWFPAQRLKVDAHMTLFHALPGRLLSEIKRDLAATAANSETLAVEAGREGVFRMGRKGVAIKVQGYEGMIGGGGEAGRICWGEKTNGVLSAQDARRDWMAHYTIMNKEEDAARVEECFNELRGGLEQTRGTVLGLRLWRYDRGWWRQEEDFLFGSGSS
ncbi:uncharacterized protein PG986_011478 [Apiospora aurea]|uniref:Uncharacterized protein n=1 Tax=Apiospora aurea TaxID=335848 RepID=A0ABR1Q586_9PEZI